MNPPSLWHDDLVYAALIRSDNFLDVVTAPIHVAPGPLVLWRGMYALIPDPEWALQLLPLVCGLAAIPLMAVVAHRLTGSAAVGMMTGAVTSLVQLLAHYSVYVRQYTVEFVVTALFLLAATRLLRDGTDVDPRRFRRVAIAGGIATFFAVPAVFVTFPIVNLGALYAMRAWIERRQPVRSILWSAAAYNVMFAAAWLLLRGRSNPIVRADYADGFLPLDSAAAAWNFLLDQGGRLMMISLPGWTEGWSFNPGEVTWTLPLVALGLVALVARQETRYVGLVVLGYAAARVVASALWIYPLGIGRPDIFSFPVTICLFAAGVHVATAALPNARTARWLAAAAAVTFALIRPVDVGYWDANGQPHLQHLLSHARADDPLMLSPTGALLAAYYGPWRVTTHRTNRISQGIEVTVDRDRTLYLPRGRRAEALAEEFLGRFPRSDRVWYFGHSVWSDAVVVKMANAGYAVQIVEESDDSRLFLGTR